MNWEDSYAKHMITARRNQDRWLDYKVLNDKNDLQDSTHNKNKLYLHDHKIYGYQGVQPKNKYNETFLKITR